MNDYQEYPRWLYGAKGATVVVRDEDHHAEQGDGWYFTPEEAREAHGETSPAGAAPDAKAALIERADAVGLEVDARWSVKTLTVKIVEAEEAAARAGKEA